MATILVTGGAGFIGSNLCKALLKEHSKIIVIDNFSDFYSPQIKEENIIKLEKIAKQCAIKNNFIFKKIDIRDKDAVGKVFSENKNSCSFSSLRRGKTINRKSRTLL